MGFPLERPQTARVFPEFFHLFPAFGAYLFPGDGAEGRPRHSHDLRRPRDARGLLLPSAGSSARRPRFWARGSSPRTSCRCGSPAIRCRRPVSQFLDLPRPPRLLPLGARRGGRRSVVSRARPCGLSLLVRIDSLLIVAPLGLYLLVRRAHGDLPWRKARGSSSFRSPSSAAHAGFTPPSGRGSTSSASRRARTGAATRCAWVGGGARRGPGHRWPRGRLGPRLRATARGPRRPRSRSARRCASSLALSVYAYFLRPLLSAWAGGDGNNQDTALSRIRRGSWRLGFRQLAAHDAGAFYRLGWFVTPAGPALGVLGLLLAIRQWRSRYLFPSCSLSPSRASTSTRSASAPTTSSLSGASSP